MPVAQSGHRLERERADAHDIPLIEWLYSRRMYAVPGRGLFRSVPRRDALADWRCRRVLGRDDVDAWRNVRERPRMLPPALRASGGVHRSHVRVRRSSRRECMSRAVDVDQPGLRRRSLHVSRSGAGCRDPALRGPVGARNLLRPNFVDFLVLGSVPRTPPECPDDFAIALHARVVRPLQPRITPRPRADRPLTGRDHSLQRANSPFTRAVDWVNDAIAGPHVVRGGDPRARAGRSRRCAGDHRARAGDRSRDGVAMNRREVLPCGETPSVPSL
jgi:hypothetical protein